MATRGHFPKPIYVTEIAELTRDDLGRIIPNHTPVGNPARIRESHHMVARLAATGMAHGEIARRTGYSNTRVSLLLNAPATKDLVEIYRNKVTERFLESVDSYMEQMFSNMTRAERHIADHLDDLDEVGELLPVKTALSISRDAADRLGYGKHSTQTNVNVDFAERLQRAVDRTRTAREINSSTEAPAGPATPHVTKPQPQPEPLPPPRLLRRA